MPARDLSKPVIGPVTSPYGPRPTPPSPHSGQDYGWLYRDPEGSRRVYAPTAGRVLVGSNPYVGNFVSLPLGDGYSTRLCHLATVNVRTGQTVTRGTLLGIMGDTGSQASGVHLHVDVFAPDGTRRDPADFYTDTFVGSPSQASSDTTPIAEDDMPRIYHQITTDGNQAYVAEGTFGFDIVTADHARAICKGLGVDFTQIPQINEFDFFAISELKRRDVARLVSIVATAPAGSPAEVAAHVEKALADDFAAVQANINDQPTVFTIRPA